MAGLLAVGFSGVAPVANAEGGGQAFQKPGKSTWNNAINIKRRGRVRIHLPMGPSYVYYDYPYYHSRGYYPTHIGGYIYYPYYYRDYYSRYIGPRTFRRHRPHSN